jgi:hypothetical protein
MADFPALETIGRSRRFWKTRAGAAFWRRRCEGDRVQRLRVPRTVPARSCITPGFVECRRAKGDRRAAAARVGEEDSRSIPQGMGILHNRHHDSRAFAARRGAVPRGFVARCGSARRVSRRGVRRRRHVTGGGRITAQATRIADGLFDGPAAATAARWPATAALRC